MRVKNDVNQPLCIVISSNDKQYRLAKAANEVDLDKLPEIIREP
jgi:predicted HAD superfamily phosphohydrolase YqeG